MEKIIILKKGEGINTHAFKADYALEENETTYTVKRNKYGSCNVVIEKDFLKHAIEHSIKVIENFEDAYLEYKLIASKLLELDVVNSELTFGARKDFRAYSKLLKKHLDELCYLLQLHHDLIVETFKDNREYLEVIQDVKSKCKGK
jgi:hypothetical protein